VPLDALQKIERRVGHDGLMSIGSNPYYVPDRTRIVEVRSYRVVRMLYQGHIIAMHPFRKVAAT
jgi:hypothetical protein